MPTSNEPVKVTPSTSGLSTSACPTTEPDPVTKLTTPSGRPASRKQSTSKHTIQAVSEAGLITIVLPVTSAAPAGPPVSANGKLNGLITNHTPYGRMIEILLDS